MEDWQSLKLKQNPDKKSVTFFGGTLISEPFRFVGFLFFFRKALRVEIGRTGGPRSPSQLFRFQQVPNMKAA